MGSCKPEPKVFIPSHIDKEDVAQDGNQVGWPDITA